MLRQVQCQWSRVNTLSQQAFALTSRSRRVISFVPLTGTLSRAAGCEGRRGGGIAVPRRPAGWRTCCWRSPRGRAARGLGDRPATRPVQGCRAPDPPDAARPGPVDHRSEDAGLPARSRGRRRSAPARCASPTCARIAMPVIRELQQATGETTTVSALVPGGRVYLDQVESRAGDQDDRRDRAPVPAARGQLQHSASSRSCPSRTGTRSLAALLDALTAADRRRPGSLRADAWSDRPRAAYAHVDGERQAGAAPSPRRCSASTARCVGALSVCGPLTRVGPAVARQRSPRWSVAAADQVSRALGWRGGLPGPGGAGTGGHDERRTAPGSGARRGHAVRRPAGRDHARRLRRRRHQDRAPPRRPGTQPRRQQGRRRAVVEGRRAQQEERSPSTSARPRARRSSGAWSPTPTW